MKIGLIAMSAKPYHIGHAAVIERAAAENDEVLLFVSISDRKRSNEMPISGQAMFKIWKSQIEKTLPRNVRVTYGGSPVFNILKTLGEARDKNSNDEFRIYGDENDLASNFPTNNLKKHFEKLVANDRIKLVPTARIASGTEMRQYLSQGDRAAFASKLPMNIDADYVWSLLNKDQANESLLRKTIRLMLQC